MLAKKKNQAFSNFRKSYKSISDGEKSRKTRKNNYFWPLVVALIFYNNEKFLTLRMMTL